MHEKTNIIDYLLIWPILKTKGATIIIKFEKLKKFQFFFQLIPAHEAAFLIKTTGIFS